MSELLILRRIQLIPTILSRQPSFFAQGLQTRSQQPLGCLPGYSLKIYIHYVCMCMYIHRMHIIQVRHEKGGLHDEDVEVLLMRPTVAQVKTEIWKPNFWDSMSDSAFLRAA